MEEELAVALGPLERRAVTPRTCQPCSTAKRATRAQDRPVMGGVPHHAALAHQALADLELRLDQRHRLARRGQHVEDGREHLLERDERDVDGGEIGRLGEGVGRAAGGRWSFPSPPRARRRAASRRAGPAPRPPRRPAIAPVLEQAVGEAARGGAHVEADAPLGSDREAVEGMRQLVAAPAHEPGARGHGARPPPGATSAPGLVHALPVDRHGPRQDERAPPSRGTRRGRAPPAPCRGAPSSARESWGCLAGTACRVPARLRGCWLDRRRGISLP